MDSLQKKETEGDKSGFEFIGDESKWLVEKQPEIFSRYLDEEGKLNISLDDLVKLSNENKNAVPPILYAFTLRIRKISYDSLNKYEAKMYIGNRDKAAKYLEDFNDIFEAKVDEIKFVDDYLEKTQESRNSFRFQEFNTEQDKRQNETVRGAATSLKIAIYNICHHIDSVTDLNDGSRYLIDVAQAI